MDLSDKENKGCNRARGPRPQTLEKYREAVELYGSTTLSYDEICGKCGISMPGLRAHIHKYYRHLLLAHNGVKCNPAEAAGIKLSAFRRQKPITRTKYKDAVEACDSMDYIEYNVSQIARMFGLDGTNLGRQLRTHYPGVIERREEMRKRLGLDDNLPRGTRPWCTEQYAGAVELLQEDRYISLQEAAERCNVSYSGLEQHLVFYHKELVDKRIGIRKKAVRQQRKGRITGRGTVHAPRPATVEKYAEALRLYRTTSLSAMKIAKQTGVSKKGFYRYLYMWHKELICKRINIPYKENDPVEFSKARKYNPATKAKYAKAIKKLQKTGLPTAKIAAEFGLQPEAFRGYLKEHEPELYARQGMMKTADGRPVSRRSMERYGEAIRQYETTPDSLRSIARRFGVDACSLGQFIKRHFPELIEKHKESCRQATNSQ